MTTDYKVTELFYIIDEFCKHFAYYLINIDILLVFTIDFSCI